MARYPSKKDTLVVAFLAVGGLALAYVFGNIIVNGPRMLLPVAIAAPAVYLGVIFGLVFPMHYTLESGTLIVRFGLARVRIPVDRMQSVQPTRSPVSAPALSLDRLRIDYQKPDGHSTFILISPADKAGFLAELAALAPHVQGTT